jgi:hypothetical protein
MDQLLFILYSVWHIKVVAFQFSIVCLSIFNFERIIKDKNNIHILHMLPRKKNIYIHITYKWNHVILKVVIHLDVYTLVELLVACAWKTWISWARMSCTMDTSWGKTCDFSISSSSWSSCPIAWYSCSCPWIFIQAFLLLKNFFSFFPILRSK